MRLVRRLLGLALVTGGVVYLRGRRRALRAALGTRGRRRALRAALGTPDTRFGHTLGTSKPIHEDLVAVATQSGIADIDPEPISHVAGKGIDPVRDIAAHEELAAQRERLPHQ